MEPEKSKPEKPAKKPKAKSKKKNCYLQSWGQLQDLSKCQYEVLNIDLQGNAIYNVFAGETHCFYFTMKNQLLGFGDDSFHQLTASEHEPRGKAKGPYFDSFYHFDPISIAIGNKIEISKLVCGAGFSFCIDNSQAVYSWGLNNKGQLGQGHRNTLVRPTLIRTLAHSESPAQTSIGKTSTQGTFSTQSQQGEVGTLGRLMGKYGLRKGEVVTDIACGGAHTLVLTSKNRVMSCGYGEAGGLGHRDAQDLESTFREVESLTASLKKKYPQDTEGLELQIKAGTSHSCCLVFNRLYVWGLFGNMTLGQFSRTPTEMNVNFEIADFECGDLLTVFLSTTGEIFTIGDWRKGVLGINRDKVEKYFTSLQREKKGRVLQSSKSQSALSRRRNASKGRKTRPGTRKEIFTPIEVKLPCKISQIAVGSRHVFALNQHAGKIYAWGDNRWKQLLPHLGHKVIWDPARVEFLNDCGSFVILCRGNNSFLISRKLIPGTGMRRMRSLEDRLKMRRDEHRGLEKEVQKLKKEASKLVKLKKELKVELKRKNKQLEKLRMTTRQEDFVEESAISLEPLENDYKWEINKIIRSFKKELSEDRTLKPHCEIDFEELELLSQISEGGFGLIFKAKWRNSVVAVKLMKQELMKKELIKDFLSKTDQMSATSWRASATPTSSSSWGPAPSSRACRSCSSFVPTRASGTCSTTKKSLCPGTSAGALLWASRRE